MKEYLQDCKVVLNEQKSSVDGLSADEAQKRLAENGRNKLQEGKKESLLHRFIMEFTDPMTIILIVAAVVSAITSAYEKEFPADVIIILLVVLINAVLGVYQETKAEKAIDALQEIAAAKSKVKRGGKLQIVPSEELVTGDVVVLEAGDSVPADCRILNCASMKIEESALTGESVPVDKQSETLPDEGEVPLGDRKNMCYMGSNVVYGHGEAVVTATGMNTEMGKIAGALNDAKEGETPLQIKLNQLSKVLSYLVLGICVFIFVLDIIRNITSGQALTFDTMLDTFMVAVSLAVAAIPEGLATVVTIVLSIGVTKMSKRNAVVRRLTAVETLGCTQIICSDKTGTLTLNKMTVTYVALGNDFIDGSPTKAEDVASKYERSVWQDLLDGCALCVNAKKDPDNPENILGDPTEGALVLFAEKNGVDAEDYEQEHPRLFEQPFDSDRKRMTVLNRMGGKNIAYTKGAADELLPLCTKYRTADGIREMTDSDRAKILELCNKMSSEALRVLGFAVREWEDVPKEETADLEKEMTFVGVVGMIDPPRKEVIKAVETCHEAGIRVVMITGDHKVTAMAIAKQLHIFREGNTVISGQELAAMTEEQLDEAVKNCVVFARVSPSDKLRIIQSLRRTGEVAAMTGDGVNDSPALKEADIGVAMGITGTDVAKDAADMILLDDNFTTIEYAIREGRRVVPCRGKYFGNSYLAFGGLFRVAHADFGGSHPFDQSGDRYASRGRAGDRSRRFECDEAKARAQRNSV